MAENKMKAPMTDPSTMGSRGTLVPVWVLGEVVGVEDAFDGSTTLGGVALVDVAIGAVTRTWPATVDVGDEGK